MAKSAQSGIGLLLHTVAVRYRVNGSGNLRSRLLSLDEVNQSDLHTLPMQSLTNRELTTLANFTEQGTRLFLQTTFIDEVMSVSKIVIFVKPVSEDYPVTSNG